MKKTTHELLESIKAAKTSHESLATGFPKLDRLLDGGFFLKEIIILGAFTGVGKSQLAGQMMLTVAQQGYKCAYFSLEISSEMVLSRLIGLKSGIKPTMVRYGNLSKEDYESKIQAEAQIESLGNLLNFYDDCYTLKDIETEVTKGQYSFVVVDFIQNIIGRGDEYSRLSESAVTLQKLAKKTNSVILVLSQLSNTIAREGAKLKNIEYKGSGSIAMVCDVGFFLTRNDGGNENGYEQANGTILSIKKNRRGLSGVDLKLGYQLPGGLIYER